MKKGRDKKLQRYLIFLNKGDQLMLRPLIWRFLMLLVFVLFFINVVEKNKHRIFCYSNSNASSGHYILCGVCGFLKEEGQECMNEDCQECPNYNKVNGEECSRDSNDIDIDLSSWHNELSGSKTKTATELQEELSKGDLTERSLRSQHNY